MSIVKRKALKRFYVVSIGFDASGHITDGQADAMGFVDENTDWPAGAEYSWFDTIDQQCEHPAFRAHKKQTDLRAASSSIDSETGLAQIAKRHANKAAEADRVLHDGVVDLARVPFLSAELAKRTNGETLNDIAAEIWGQYSADALPESERIQLKRDARDD